MLVHTCWEVELQRTVVGEGMQWGDEMKVGECLVDNSEVAHKVILHDDDLMAVAVGVYWQLRVGPVVVVVEVEVQVEMVENTVVVEVVGIVAVVVRGKNAASAAEEVVGMADPRFLLIEQMTESKAPAEVQRKLDSVKTGFVAEPEVIDSVGKGVEEEH